MWTCACIAQLLQSSRKEWKCRGKGLWDNWAKHQKHALHSFSHLQYYIPKHHNQSSQEVTGVLSYVCSLLPVLHACVYKQKGGNTLVLPPNHQIWVPYVIHITLWKAYRNMNKELEPDCCPRREVTDKTWVKLWVYAGSLLSWICQRKGDWDVTSKMLSVFVPDLKSLCILGAKYMFNIKIIFLNSNVNVS